MKLDRWNPARDLFRTHDEMGRLIDRFLSNDFMGGQSLVNGSDWFPGTDIAEDDHKYTVSIELPGMTKKDVSIVFKENTLIIEGEKKQEETQEGKNFHRVERSYGKFQRSFKMPAAVKDENISASYKDGVLTVELPKAEEAKPKAIEVKVK